MARKITSEAIGQMREILSGIVLGKLKHNQNVWHRGAPSASCGTAHCVAGWNTALNHRELYKKFEAISDKEYRETGRVTGHWMVFDEELGGDSEIATKDWGLHPPEAHFMFHGGARLRDQIGMIEFLADGYRLNERTRDRLNTYTERYESSGVRTEWAKQFEQPRPNADLVKNLLCGTPVQEREVVVEKVVEQATA